MAFCRRCGKKLDDGTDVCPDCGEPAQAPEARGGGAPRQAGIQSRFLTFLIIGMLLMAAGAYLFPMHPQNERYDVTVTIEEICVSDPTDWAKESNWLADVYVEVHYGDADDFDSQSYRTKRLPVDKDEYWHCKIYKGPGDPKPMKIGEKVTFSVDADTVGDIRIGLDMKAHHSDSKDDTLDIFTPDDDIVPRDGKPVECPGYSGLIINGITVGVKEYCAKGDSAPIGYIKYTIAVEGRAGQKPA